MLCFFPSVIGGKKAEREVVVWWQMCRLRSGSYCGISSEPVLLQLGALCLPRGGGVFGKDLQVGFGALFKAKDKKPVMI